MTFERGFKSFANKIALDVRDELELAPYATLCPWKLADHLGIPVITLAELAMADPTIAEDVEHLARRASQVFSAITLFHGATRSIVHNHGHALNRQRSNLAHELAHALLMHPPHPPFGAGGQRVYERKIEAEAGWLGPVLLIPNEAARWAVARGMSEETAADHFGVSQDLAKFRYGMSGARKISHYRRRAT